MNKMILFVAVFLFVPVMSYADQLEDNSFLAEEAYNQEAGVVQFIQLHQKQSKNKNWNYLFINEIPIDGQTNQFSYEVPISYLENVDKTQSKDIKLNYRRELFRDEYLVTTVRTSLTTHSGDSKLGFGAGANGYELALISSLKVGPSWSQHWNVGAGITPKAKNATDESADISKYFWAISNIYFFTDSFNFMLEITGTSSEEVAGENTTAWSSENIVSPSLRYAIDYNEWQFVPGIALPIGVGNTAGQNQTLVYLSIEGKLF